MLAHPSLRRLAAGFLMLGAAAAALAGSAETAHVTFQRHPVATPTARGAYQVENFRWGFENQGFESPVFKRTTIRPEKIKKVFYWSENFPPTWLAAHGMLFFQFEDEGGVVAEDGSRSIGMVLSVEAFLKQGQKYSLLGGMNRKTFGLVHMLTTIEDRMYYAVVARKHSIDQYELILSQEQKENLVRSVLEEATLVGKEGDRYHTTRDSCVTRAAQAVDKVLDDGRRLKKWAIPGVLVNLSMAMPKFTYRYMIRKKVAKPRHSRIDTSVRRLRFPTPGGEAVVDLTRMPGYWVAPEMLAFDENLELFFERAQAVEDMARLQGLMNAADPRLMQVHQALNAAQDAAGEAMDGLVELLAQRPAATLDFYLGQDVKEKPGVKYLDQALLERLRFLAGKDPKLAPLVGKATKGFAARR